MNIKQFQSSHVMMKGSSLAFAWRC